MGSIDVTINPGTGPVNGATENNATKNIEHFITDCENNKVKGIQFVRIPDSDYGNGRYAFLLWVDQRCHEIQMPGLQLDKVRYINPETQNIWDYPRLYVDGSSWVWKFALMRNEADWSCCADH